jgi:hypothetical protein
MEDTPDSDLSQRQATTQLDPFNGLPVYTIGYVLENSDLRNPNILSYVRRETLDEPTSREWLETVVDTNGELALLFYHKETTAQPRRHYVIARDENGWLAAWREWDKSYTKAYHVRPTPGTAKAWVENAEAISICHRTDVPNAVTQLFSQAPEIDTAIHDDKPDVCTGCKRSLYTSDAPTQSETDFRLDREQSSDRELIWQCVNCQKVILEHSGRDTT